MPRPRRQFVSTGEAAKALGVDLRSLQRWAAAGLIEPDYRTPGGHARWDVDRVRAELRSPSLRAQLDEAP